MHSCNVGKMAEDTLKLGHLELKPNFKIMMVGSTEADIEDACQRPNDIGEVIDDFEENEAGEENLENSSIYLAKIQKYRKLIQDETYFLSVSKPAKA